MFGLSNYSVKKILPRLIIVAIAINLSFYICAIIADATNIIGANVGSFIAGGAPSPAGLLGVAQGFDKLVFGSILAIILVVTAGGTILLSLAIILVLIALRNVVITLLIVISPIAFALYLLPNTENLFKKWLNEFVRMLLVYPMLSAVFGACVLTDRIIASGSVSTWLDWLLHAVLVFVPIAAILPIMKMGGQAMGALSGAMDKLANATGARQLAEGSDKRRRERIGGNIRNQAANRFDNLADNGNSRFSRFVGRRGQGVVYGRKRHDEAMDDLNTRFDSSFRNRQLRPGTADYAARQRLDEAKHDAERVKLELDTQEAGRKLGTIAGRQIQAAINDAELRKKTIDSDLTGQKAAQARGSAAQIALEHSQLEAKTAEMPWRQIRKTEFTVIFKVWAIKTFEPKPKLCAVSLSITNNRHN